MNNTRRTVARNAGSLIAAQIVTWSISLILMIFLPRYLGVANMGKLSLAHSIWAILAIFITFGMDILLVKEIARNPEKTSEYVFSSVLVRGVLYLVGLGIVTIYLNLAQYPADTVEIIYIIGFSVLINQISGTFFAALQGLERMEFFSLSDVISKAVTSFVIIGLLLSGYGVRAIAWVYSVGALISLSIQLFALRRFSKLRFDIHWGRMIGMFKDGFQYLLVSVFLVLYIQVDIIILSLILDETSIGWYGVADTLFSTLLFVPSVFITAIFPVLSRLYSDGSDKLPRLINKSFDLLLLVSIPIGLGVMVVSRSFVVMLYGADFANSGPILAILGVVIILTYQNVLIGRYFISIDRQKVWTIVMAVATVATIPLDLIFVPWCQAQFGNGAMGGALSFVVTEGGMLIAGMWMLPRGTLGWNNAWVALRVVLAGVVMTAVAWQLRDQFIIVPILVGGILYVGMILLLRVIPKEDWALIQSLLQNVLGRFRKSKSNSPA